MFDKVTVQAYFQDLLRLTYQLLKHMVMCEVNFLMLTK